MYVHHKNVIQVEMRRGASNDKRVLQLQKPTTVLRGCTKALLAAGYLGLGVIDELD